MHRKATNNTAALPYDPIEDSDISKQTNRFTADTEYDDAGNVTQDNRFRGLSYSYDANGRMFRASDAARSLQSDAVYDGSGLRVVTRVNGAWTFFVHDAFGKMVAEYGGPQQTDEGGVRYVLSDWQGSTRATVSNTGFVQSRSDYTAYGEEIGAAVGQRTTVQGFGGANGLRQKYALTERDDATGLDHTWFRKHENQAGRWTSPDPYNGSASVADGQSWNRYAYVGGDPANFVDPSGLNRAGPGTRYGPYDPMGITYYVDGFLSDARTAWGILGAGAGYIESHNIGGLIVVDSVEYRMIGRDRSERPIFEFRNFQQSYFYTMSNWPSDTPEEAGSGDCIPGIPCVKEILEKAIARAPELEKCLQAARDSAVSALNELRSRLPFDGTWASQVGVSAAGGAYLGKSGGPKAIAAGAVVGAVTTAYPRASERLVGWYQIVWGWQAAVKRCGAIERALPRRFKFPY